MRDYTKWDDQPAVDRRRAGSFARAYRVMMTEPQGPVYMCYDAWLQEDPLDREMRAAVAADAAQVPSRMAADPAALRAGRRAARRRPSAR